MGMVAATVIGAAATVFSGISQASAASQQADAQRQEADYAAKQYNFNAERARTEADDISAQARDEEAQIRAKANRIKGAQRAQAGASGIDVGTGSPLDQAFETEYMEDQDASTIRYNAKRSQGAKTSEAQNYEWNAKESKNLGYAKASATENAGKSALWGSLLGAGSLVSSKWDYMAGNDGGRTKYYDEI